jgi:HAD superfamily hydrolase (TIGR01549 family)
MAMPPPGSRPADTAVLDVDGTLVDSVYHHVVAWARAFGSVDVAVPLWRVHRSIGMGGDRLVTAVAGDSVEDEYGDRLRTAHDKAFDELIDRVRPLDGARELMAELGRRGLKVVIASSGKPEHTSTLLGLVGADEHADGATTSEDAEESKPDPELIDVAIDRVSGDQAVVVGDAVWDMQSAVRAGQCGIGLRTGGFGEAELREAGAVHVFDGPRDLLDHLDETPLGGNR